MIQIEHIYISPGHNFFGHFGKPPGDNPTVEVDEVECVAGRGLRGDRFFDHKEDYKGQITFFSMEIFEALSRTLGVDDGTPGAFRRNVLTRGVDLNTLIDREFEIQGVRFAGTSECSPCFWMDKAFAPGAEEALEGQGGLRARILTDGILRVDGG
jgi:MOSC domain-containing protein YiiM